MPTTISNMEKNATFCHSKNPIISHTDLAYPLFRPLSHIVVYDLKKMKERKK